MTAPSTTEYHEPSTHTLRLPAEASLRGFDDGVSTLPELPERIRPVQIYLEHDDGVLKSEFTIAGRRIRVFEQNQGGYAAEIVMFDIDHLEQGTIFVEFDSLDEAENESLNLWIEEVHRRLDALVYGVAVETTASLQAHFIDIATGGVEHGAYSPLNAPLAGGLLNLDSQSRAAMKHFLMRNAERLADAVLDSLSAAGGEPEWDSGTIENVLSPFEPLVKDAGLPWLGSTGDSPEEVNVWRRMTPGSWEELCPECGEEGHDCAAAAAEDADDDA